ncbi:hypothetical protein BD626DRAFT_508849, partial [Schizophyllum amplum]
MSPPMRQALPRIFQAQAGENGAPYVNMHNGASIAPAPVRGKPRIFAAAEESSAMYPTNVEDMAAKSYPSPPTEFSPPKRRLIERESKQKAQCQLCQSRRFLHSTHPFRRGAREPRDGPPREAQVEEAADDTCVAYKAFRLRASNCEIPDA